MSVILLKAEEKSFQKRQNFEKFDGVKIKLPLWSKVTIYENYSKNGNFLKR